jgi:hypothetical protein
MPDTPIPPIELLTVDAIQLSESTGDVGLGGFQEQMIVVPHEAVRVTAHAPTLYDRLKNVQEGHAIDIIEKDRLPSVASRQNVEKLTSDLES